MSYMMEITMHIYSVITSLVRVVLWYINTSERMPRDIFKIIRDKSRPDKTILNITKSKHFFKTYSKHYQIDLVRSQRIFSLKKKKKQKLIQKLNKINS